MIFKMVLHDERGLSILKCSILWWITPMLTFIYNKNPSVYQSGAQRYTYRVFQTIQMKLILLCVWVEQAVLGSAKTALKFIYEI